MLNIYAYHQCAATWAGCKPSSGDREGNFQDRLNKANPFFSLPVTAHTSQVSDLELPHAFPGILSSRPTSFPRGMTQLRHSSPAHSWPTAIIKEPVDYSGVRRTAACGTSQWEAHRPWDSTGVSCLCLGSLQHLSKPGVVAPTQVHLQWAASHLCQVEKGSVLTGLFWELAPGVFCCLKVTFAIVMSWDSPKHLRDLRTLWEAFVYLCLEEAQSLGKEKFQRCFWLL